MNRPYKANAMNLAMWHDLRRAARPYIKAEPQAEAEYERKVLRIHQLRERWDLL